MRFTITVGFYLGLLLGAVLGQSKHGPISEKFGRTGDKSASFVRCPNLTVMGSISKLNYQFS